MTRFRLFAAALLAFAIAAPIAASGPTFWTVATSTDLLKGIVGTAQVRFTAADVVRHPLVGRIVEAYDAAERPPGSGI